MPAEVLSKRRESEISLSVSSSAKIRRECGPGLMFTRVEAGPVSDIHLTITPKPAEAAGAMIGRLAEVLNEFKATVVQQIIFGSVKAHPQTLAAVRQALDDPMLPVTWVEGSACGDRPIAGIQVHAISGTRVRTIGQDATARGRVWSDAVATHFVLGALGPTHNSLAQPQQAGEAFGNLQRALSGVRMTMRDVARTWFFLEDILSWYGEFNHVRNDFFSRCELRPGNVPASTGVNGHNPAGAALTAAAWALRAHDPSTTVVEFLASPRQCPAPTYGSAFSRAVELNLPGYRQILVSGTASIEPGGRTAHVGDVEGQIELTMQVVEAILASRRMSFAEVSRATAYFKFAGDVSVFDDWLARHDLRAMPTVRTCCGICRDDLLFEFELDAIQEEG